MPSTATQPDLGSTHETGIGGDSTGGQAELPDHVIVALLQREHVLMLAGMHLLNLRMFSEAEHLENLTRHQKQVSTAWHGTA